MEKYDTYKDSGIEWIGAIPAHWEVKKLSYCFEKIGSGTTPKSTNQDYYFNGDFNWLQTGDLTDNLIFRTSKKITQKALNDYSTLNFYPLESIVIAMYGATIGKMGLLKIETTTNQACCVLAKPNNVFSEFVFYWFRSIKKHIISLSYGGGQPNINQEQIRNLRIQLPLLEEQTKIANYLDKKTAEIDDLIAQKKKLLKLYKKEKEVIINQAVTKGINPNVKLKNSGIEWLGDIPEHWEVKRLKYVLESQNTKRVPLSSSVRGEMMIKEYDYYGASGVIDKVDDYIFNEPLILIGEDGANLLTRSKRLVFIAKGKYWVNNHAHILKPKYGLMYYYSELLELYDFSIWVTGSAQPKLTSENLLNIPMIVPPIEEQKEIAEFLDKYISEIESKSTKTKKLIALLTEYKTALISEVVTGKIKIN
ncbi:MAG: type I restriction enzyme S subunit [Flammeovirgaceae bacterium]|jgi:type I restriction enzyme S subunit